MKRITILAALLLAGCGGSPQSVSPVAQAPAPAEVTTPAPDPAPAPEPVPPPKPPPAPRTDAVIFIGDSITATWKLPAAYINAGISGQSSYPMLDRYKVDVLDKNPRIVHILAGTNDLAGNSTTTANIQRMIEWSQADGTCVILGTLPPRADGLANASPERIAQFNADLKTLAASFGVRVADYHAVLVTATGDFDPALFQDPVHPNDAGHAKMWTLVEPLIHLCGG